jgi:RND family efflux transporter MFP subunit
MRPVALRTIGCLVLALAVAALIAIADRHSSESGQKQNAIETAPVEYREIEQIVRASGEVAAAQASEIKSEISGRVAKLNVKAGDQVKAAQVLIELDDLELKSEQQEATFRIDASAIRQAKAQMDFDRKAELRSKQFVMDKELEDAKTELSLATNALDIDRARLQTIKERLVKSVIRAPHDGTVLNVKVHEGVVVIGATNSGDASLLMQVADLNELQIQSEINEVDVIKISIGMKASITFDSVPGLTLPGVVQFVSPSALAKDKDRSIRVFPMTLSLGAAGRQVKPGISANITISAAKNSHALAVSLAAVFTENNEPAVFVQNGNRFERRPVVLGINDSSFVEITSGVKAGDRVALQRPPAGS